MRTGDRKAPYVLLVNTSDKGGGAEMVSTRLHSALQARGYRSILAVGHGETSDSRLIPNWMKRSTWARAMLAAAENLSGLAGGVRGTGTGSRAIRWLAEPVRDTRKRLGHEDFYFPGTAEIFDLAPYPIDLVHLHNLHGDYFDLRQVPTISGRVPTAVTLHDQWLMTGHCAYSIDCERWTIGCGQCPHLDTYPAIPKDATKGNLRRKKNIYSQSRLHVSAPSQWLLDQIPDSVLSSAVLGVPRLIPNGVDQGIFNQSSRSLARSRLELPDDAVIVTFVANFAISNPYKDWALLHESLRIIGERSAKGVLAFAIGESGERSQLGNVTLQPVGRVDDRVRLAHWYRASDLYIQPSRADNHPLTVLEALSCGTPVLATAVGGIPEQVQSLASIPGVEANVPPEQATGALVPAGDPKALAECLLSLIGNPGLLAQLGENAAGDAQRRFTLDRYVSDTLTWYEDIWESQMAPDSSGLPRSHS